MWLSEVVRKDAKAAEALTDLVRAIRRHEDATRPENRGFWSTGLRLFRPKVWLYCTMVVAFGLAGGAIALTTANPKPDLVANASLQILVAIFVIGVSVYSLVTSFSEQARFASEYLYEACRMKLFNSLALFGLLVAASVFAIADKHPHYATILSYASLGAAIACATGLGYITHEIARCMTTRESTQTACGFAARKLAHALLREAYLGVWSKTHRETLQEWCKEHFKVIMPPSDYLVSHIRGAEGGRCEDEVPLPFPCDIERGYLDYNLERLKQLDRLLQSRDADARLYLTPHMWTGGAQARLGRLSARTAGELQELKAQARKLKCCRFRRDGVQQPESYFMYAMAEKIRLAIDRCAASLEPENAERYLRVMAYPLNALGDAWGHRVVRDWYRDYMQEAYRLVHFYLRVMKQIVQRTEWPIEPCGESKAEFAELVCDAVRQRAEGLFKHKHPDHVTLQLFAVLIPWIYGELLQAGRNGETELMRIRGRLGTFYVFPSGLFEELPASASEEDKREMRRTLHEGVARWLKMALDKGDTEMVKSLCSAAGDLVYGEE